MEFPSDIRRKKEFLIRKTRVAKAPTQPQQGASARRHLSFENTERFQDKRGNASTFYRRSQAPGSSSDYDQLQQHNFSDSFDEIASTYWPPGRAIPIAHGSSNQSSPGPEYAESDHMPASSVVDVLQSFQCSMEKKLEGIEGKLVGIGDRISKVEAQQGAMEKQLSMAAASPATRLTISSKTTPNRRRKVTPTSLQSKIRQVHSVLTEEGQIKITEAINSPHNSKVVQEIVAAIGTDNFDEYQIRTGCRTYRKTLVAKSKDVRTPVKKKKQERSRKQRSYERRGRAIKAAKLWAEVTADMMSDEEQEGELYIRHPPSYRSSALRSFITKLDSRLEAEGGSVAHPRTERRLGSPRLKTAPPLASKWTISKRQQSDAVSVADKDLSEEVTSTDESESEEEVN